MIRKEALFQTINTSNEAEFGVITTIKEY